MSAEIIVFTAFIVFILGMLALDLGIFDRKSHEVKFKEALIWTLVWISLALGFYLFIRLRGEMIHGLEGLTDLQNNIDKYRHPISISGLSLPEALEVYRKNLSLEYLTGYLIEYMLSVDNVFVIILVFLSFNVQKIYYKRVLFWGILGAIVMRFIFIFSFWAILTKQSYCVKQEKYKY